MSTRVSSFARGALCVGLLAVIASPLPADAGPCGDLAPRGDVRAQLAVLGCLTGIATARPDASRSLRATIERGFREAYEDLCKRPLLDEELGAWTELYRLWARFYPKREQLAPDLPIAFVNSHHFSLPHWVERSLQTPLGTLIHFDTHSDMEGMPRVDDVRRAVEDLRHKRNEQRAWHILAHSAYRNSMPVTGAVLAAGVNEVIWAKPAWSHDPVDFVSRAFFYARPKGFADPRPLEALEAQGPDAFVAAFRAQTSDFFMLHYDPLDNGGAWLPRREREIETWSVTDKRQRPHGEHFEHVADIRFSILTTDRPDFDPSLLIKAISGPKFVLDIDLDYFVNQGAPPEQETTDDFSSYGQRAMQRRDEPDSSLSVYLQRRHRAAAVAAERTIIERRIRRFRDTLRALKAAGKSPSIVSIADSANLPFAARIQGQEQSEFVPPHHAYWVHERVTSAIREVFGDGATSNLGDGPKTAALPAPAKRKAEALVPPEHKAYKQVRETLRDALYGALSWATAAATTYAKTAHLSAYLLIIHTIAQHAPDAALREAARAAGEVHAKLTLDPATLGPAMSASRAGVDEALRRIYFAQRYGSNEWEPALAGARWLAKYAGLTKEPDLDAETQPLQPSAALAALGLRRAFAAGGEANLVDVFLGSQATDGGFTVAEMPAVTRAVYSLTAVRAICALLGTAELVEPKAKPLWDGSPITRATIDRAVLRGVLFVMATIGELPNTEPAIDALLALRTASELRDLEAASQFARNAGKLLAVRIATKVPVLVGAIADADQISAFAEFGSALGQFGVDVSQLRAALQQRAGAFPKDRILGVLSRGAPTYADLTRLISRAAALTRFGITGFDYAEALRQALPRTAAAAYTADSVELVDRFTAVTQTILTASGHNRADLAQAQLPGEWRFLEAVYGELLGARRPDMIATMLEARLILGEPESSPRVRDLVWQLLHEQNPDGSWGRRTPEDGRIRGTWAALAALAPHARRADDVLVRAAAPLLQDRPPPPAVKDEQAATPPVVAPKTGRAGARRGAVIVRPRGVPAIRGR